MSSSSSVCRLATSSRSFGAYRSFHRVIGTPVLRLLGQARYSRMTVRKCRMPAVSRVFQASMMNSAPSRGSAFVTTTAVGNAGLPDLHGGAEGRQDRLGFVVVGDDDVSAAGEHLAEHVAAFERAGAVDEDGVVVAELADPGELGRVQFMDDVVPGVLHELGEVVGVGLGVDVNDQGTAVAAAVWAASESVTMVLPTPPF